MTRLPLPATGRCRVLPYRSGQAAVMYANLRLASILSVIPPSKPPSLPSLTLSVHRHVYA